MPRSARDSDEDVETRIGRKTRTGSGIPESPVRRSTRNRQSTKPNDSFSDLSVTETKNTQANRNFRKRAGTIDTTSLEVQRSLRSTRNAIDLNETKDSEGSVEVQPKKLTRRSIAVTNAPDTPKSNILTRRLTRAGSETKSMPAGRTTRKTRASSMDPEPTIDLNLKEKYDIEEIGTPSRIKRRASILPTNAPVIEEEKVLRVDLEDILLEENESIISKNLKIAKKSDKAQESHEKKSNEENENVKNAEEKDCSESHDVPEEDLPDDKGSKISSLSEIPKTSEKELITELNKSKTAEEAKKNDVQNVDEGDDMTSTGMFQDISADEWKQKHQTINVENDTNSVHSTSTVKLENESETECDLVLVDKKAWLAAESLKTAQDKEVFEYDSDDTVVLKSKMDYLKDKINMSNEKKSSKDNDKHDSSKLSIKEEQAKTNKITESSQNKSRRDKSLNKTEDKQLKEEEKLILAQKETEDHKELDKPERPASDKKQKKNRSLNSSLNKKGKLKQKSTKYNRLHISSSTSSISSAASTSGSENKIKLTSSGKKRSNKNYSTMVHIGSDSDSFHDSTDSSDNDTENKSLRIPRFLFKNKECEVSDESNEDGSSKASIDSDINAEYNLDGKTIGKFSDDDIPGDECRASESESSDPDDNGSDLADFVVDDDEVEEEEEEEDEDEDENEEDVEEQEQEQEQEQEEIEKEDQEKNLNESEIKLFKRKAKAANNSLICSTPKADVHQHEQYKHNISSEKKKRKYAEKISINNESEKTHSKDLSIDNSDSNKTTLNMSANAKKRLSMEKNISADLQELIKDTNLPKSLLSKKAHLNKTLSPSSETPTVKYLRKQKLNESAPVITLEEIKAATENVSLIDKKKDIAIQDEPSTAIIEKTVDTVEIDKSLSTKRKISTEALDSDDQAELRPKKISSKIEQVSEVDDKVQLNVEKENVEYTLNVDDGKKKRKRRNKKKNANKLEVVNTNTEDIKECIVNKEKIIEVTSSAESKKNKKNKKKRNIENLDKNDEKSSNIIEASSKDEEVENIPKKKKKNEQFKKLSQQNAKLSYDATESTEFLKSKCEALEAAKRAAESIKASKISTKKRTKNFEKMQEVKETGKPNINAIMIPSTRGIKRLSLEVIENLSDTPLRPHKKQKLSQTSVRETSHIITKGGFRESAIAQVNEDFFVPSNSGGTTTFTVVNLQKAKKQLKKIPAVASFRQKMLSRNSRYPVTSYIMYLQKQKVTARNQGFVKQV